MGDQFVNLNNDNSNTTPPPVAPSPPPSSPPSARRHQHDESNAISRSTRNGSVSNMRSMLISRIDENKQEAQKHKKISNQWSVFIMVSRVLEAFLEAMAIAMAANLYSTDDFQQMIIISIIMFNIGAFVLKGVLVAVRAEQSKEKHNTAYELLSAQINAFEVQAAKSKTSDEMVEILNMFDRQMAQILRFL
jgi:hypothetical protein